MKIAAHVHAFIAAVLIILTSCNSSFSEHVPIPQTNTTPGLSQTVPGRPDNLSQAVVDELLANGEMNFDGLRFDNKRMDFINFNKGSFRGTTFNNTVLNDGVARRKNPEPDKFDFEDANFFRSKLKRVTFSHWKFIRSAFQADSVSDAKFYNCVFNASKFQSCFFNNVNFNNGLQNAVVNSHFYTCLFDGCKFDSVRFEGGVFTSSSRFSSTTFKTVRFFNVNFGKVSPSSGTTFTGGSHFDDAQFISSNLEGAVLGEANQSIWFQNVGFDNVNWRHASVNASFNARCMIKGAATILNNTDFTTSVFNDVVFGVQNAPYMLKIKQCKFDNCQFLGNAIFYNCDLENSTFPPRQVLEDAGVRFVNCLNAPYNSIL